MQALFKQFGIIFSSAPYLAAIFLPMNDEYYPALYRSASQLSMSSQCSFFRALRWHLVFLVFAAVISVINSPKAELAIVQALILFAALACSVYLFAVRPDQQWYSGRAMAESIKTVTWRFISRSEPFETSNEEARSHLMQTLKAIVEQNKHTAKQFSTDLDGDQIPEELLNLRQKSFEIRKQFYIDFRIADQQKWYANKASFNRKMAKVFFVALIVTNTIAVICAVTKINFPTAQNWPTDAFIALAAGLLSWMQAKRFSELAASYALAAHEISLIKEQSWHVVTEKEFSSFVGDAENAFSREHTQWIARKDA